MLDDNSLLIKLYRSIWYNNKFRDYIYQAVFVLICVTILIYFYINTHNNLTKQEIASGFDFLSIESSFEISESLIEYSPNSSYFKAFLVGLLNTLKVSVIGNILAIIIGLIIALMSISKNYLLSNISKIYIDVLRNVPLLLQLLLWYSIFIEVLPSSRESINPISNVYVSNRGVFLPEPSELMIRTGIISLACLMITFFIIFILKKIEKTKDYFFNISYLKICSFTFITSLILSWFLLNASNEINIPRLEGFNFEGGMFLSPEFLSLLFGLTIYTSVFISEIIRSGISSVKKGQWEASKSLGLNYYQTMSMIVLPQALRVIVPPTTSQILNLTKNSSLAVAIGYPDLVSISNTALNQTGQAIEIITLTMIIYLIFSLITSLIMNYYNKQISIADRV